MLWLLLCVFIGAGEIEQDGEDSRISDRQTPIQPGHGRQLSRRTPGGWTSEHDHNMSDGHIVPPPAGYREGPHPVISGTSSDLLISLLIVNCSKFRSSVLFDYTHLRLCHFPLHVLRLLLVWRNANSHVLDPPWERREDQEENNLQKVCLSLSWGSPGPVRLQKH